MNNSNKYNATLGRYHKMYIESKLKYELLTKNKVDQKGGLIRVVSPVPIIVPMTKYNIPIYNCSSHHEDKKIKLDCGPDEKTKPKYINLDANICGDEKKEDKTKQKTKQKAGAPKSAINWVNLKHNGVMFYPPYEPHEISINYNGNRVSLNSKAEEFITYYVHPRFDKYKNKRFDKNFFNDWKKLLSADNLKLITDFSLVDATDIKNNLLEKMEIKREENKKKSKDQREKEKAEREKETDKYRYAMVDEAKQVIDNYLVEPPTIFIGRGEHPLSGSIKYRLGPEDIILNVGPDMPIPVAVVGSDTSRTWGEIISDPTLEWIASWQNNVTGKNNYARFGRRSSFKMKSDESKYDLAKQLKRRIKKIRDQNENYMKSDRLEYRQLAVALFLIDRLALRIGNEKRNDEADTVGVTTLKVKNISLLDNNTIKLDFLGKDSIRYINKFEVPNIVYQNIKEFIEDSGKKNNSDLFDLVTSDSLNKYIKSFMKKLTSKVFRTYNASYLMQIELRKITKILKDYDKPDKIQKFKHLYEMANLKVAKLCNHRKAETTSSSKNLENTNKKINDIRLKINRLNRERKKKQEAGKKITAINKRITSQQNKMKVLKNKKKLQIESKSLSTGTSKINYIDPRITISFLKNNNLMDSIDKFFNKSHQKHFEWAMDVDSNYMF
jgi:DNA topoisomerase-1